MRCKNRGLEALALLGFWRFFLAVLGVCSATLVHSTPYYDARTSATAIAPPPPVLTLIGVPAIIDSIQYVATGDTSKITLQLDDPAAKGFPGSLTLGIFYQGYCTQDKAALPKGASMVVQNVSDSRVTGLFTWPISSETNTTEITFCGQNNFWEELVSRKVIVSTGGLVKGVSLTSATFNGKTRQFHVAGKVIPQSPKLKLKGKSVLIANAANGESLLSGLVKNGNLIQLTSRTTSSASPADLVFASVAGVSSQPRQLVAKNATPTPSPVPVTESITVTTPVDGENGAILGQRYTYQIKATSSLGSTLSYELVSGPQGLGVSASGLVSWTPTSQNSSVGTHFSYTVKVTSSKGASTTQLLGLGVCSQGTAWMDGMGGMCM